MKKLALTLCLAAFTTGAFAQGLVNFLNSPTTLISAAGASTAANQAGTYYFGLFTAPVGTTAFDAFTFSGVYGTNQAAAGRFTGGTGLPVTGWAAGDTRAFYVLGWSATYGHDPLVAIGYLNANLAPVDGFAGRSAIGPAGVAGGGPLSLPNLNIFGGTQGLTAGFNMVAIPVPEPTSFALAGLGAAALLIFRRRK